MTRPVFEEGYSKEHARAGYRTSQLERRPHTPGTAVYQIEVFEPDKLVEVQDEKFEWEVPEDLDGCTLVKVDAYLTTPSSSGTVEVQLAKLDDGFGLGDDILSTKIGIPAGEVNLKEAATQPVIADPEATYDWGDHIRVDIDNAGSGAYGLGLITYWTPAANANIAIRGAKGDPGGVNNWTGSWQSGGFDYLEGDAVSHDGTSYVARVDHNSSAASEPGVGVDWEDYWMVLAERQFFTALTVQDNNQDQVLDIGTKAMIHFPFPATILGWTLLANLVGDLELDIWVDSYGNFPPTIADSIVASAPPQLVAQRKNQDTTLAGWTTSIAEDSVMQVEIATAPSVVTFFSLTLKLGRF